MDSTPGADYTRDLLQVRQQQIRLKQLEKQARLEVEDALIAMRRARASYGASVHYFVIQYENPLSQAKSTEVAAKSAYAKARAALQRANGAILEENGISVETALRNR